MLGYLYETWSNLNYSKEYSISKCQSASLDCLLKCHPLEFHKALILYYSSNE